MRLHTTIFSAAFIIILGILHVQPLLFRCDARTMQQDACAPPQDCIKKPEPVCKRNKCTLPVSPEEKEDCNNSGCNPCVPCSAGFCCFVVESIIDYNISSTSPATEMPLLNDNRLASGLSECWHPPEMIS